MPNEYRKFGHSVLRKIVVVLAVGFCASSAVAEAPEEVFTRGFVKIIARAHGFCIGQSSSVDSIERDFPDLVPVMQRAELLFTAGTGNVCHTAKETLVDAIGAENARRVTDQMREQFTGIVHAPDRATAIGFIHELEARANWVIDPAILPALLAVRYSASPVSEFADGHVGRYEGAGDPKLLGVELSLKLPISWKEKAGDRPHVVRKWVEKGGTGLNSIMLMVKNFGEPLGPEDLADFGAIDPAEVAPDGATVLDGGGFVLEGLAGLRSRFRMSTQRIDISLDQIIEQYMLPMPSGRIVFISCYVGTEIGEADTLQRRFELIDPLCHQVVNSLVLRSLY